MPTLNSALSCFSLEFQSRVLDSFLDRNLLSCWYTTGKIPKSHTFSCHLSCLLQLFLHLSSLPQVTIINHSGVKKKPKSLLSDSKWHPCTDIGCLTSPLLFRSWTKLTACSLIFDLDPAGFALCFFLVSH